jgi:hypothetical protein
MTETRESRLQRQRGEQYRRGDLARRKNRYRQDATYRELCKARSKAFYARKVGQS